MLMHQTDHDNGTVQPYIIYTRLLMRYLTAGEMTQSASYILKYINFDIPLNLIQKHILRNVAPNLVHAKAYPLQCPIQIGTIESTSTARSHLNWYIQKHNRYNFSSSMIDHSMSSFPPLYSLSISTCNVCITWFFLGTLFSCN
jgi:hypothetical protein